MLKKIKMFKEIRSISCLILLFLLVGIVNSDFLTVTSILNCFNDSVVFTLLAVGIAFVIFTGEIDVSIGAILGLTAAVSSTLLRDGYSLVIALSSAILIGGVIGAINGYCVSYLKIPSLILTLATNGICRGFVYVYTHGSWVENLPAYFTGLSQLKVISHLTAFYAATLIIVILLDQYVKMTKKGKSYIAVGDNFNGAMLVGIKANQVKFKAYIICGVFAAIAGVCYTSRIGFITPLAGNGYEMKAIAACVIGGASLVGGQGTLLGVAVGAVIMSSINRILVFIGLSSNYDNTITGILLITLVVADALLQKRSDYLLKCQKQKTLVTQAEMMKTGGKH